MQAFSSHDIFQTLYQQIMLLELKPGSTLRENALCEQFGVSRTPVRSVLQELRIAGLIEVTPYKSTRVTQLDFDTISQQIYLRNAVESAVMTDFAAACTPEQLAQLKTRNDALRRLAAQPHPDPRMFYELDRTRLRPRAAGGAGQPPARKLVSCHRQRPAVAADPDFAEQLFAVPHAGSCGRWQFWRYCGGT